MPGNITEELPTYAPQSPQGPSPADNAPKYPYWLYDRPSPQAIATNGGSQAGPNVNLGAIAKVVTGGTMAGLLFGAPIWGKSVLSLSRYPNAPDPIAKIAQAIATITAWWKPRENKLSHDISKGSVHLNADLTHALDLIALRMEQLAFGQAFLANDVALAVGRLVRIKLPQIIERHLRPILIRLGKAERLSGQALLQVRALRRQTRRDLQRLQRDQIDPLKKPVRVTLPGRITRVEKDVKTVKKVQTQHTQRLKQLTFILVPALATTWLIKTLTRSGLKWVLCQNMKDFGTEICNSPSGTGGGVGRFLKSFWRAFGGLPELLLAATFDAFLLTDACAIVGAIEDIAISVSGEIDALVLSIEGFVCGGKSGAPSGILNSDYARASDSLSAT